MIKSFQKSFLILIIIGITFLITVQCEASEETGFTKYNFTNLGFSFSTPNYWKMMSDEIIDQYKQDDSKDVFYVTGFELNSSEQDTVFPYILISVDERGKPSINALASYQQLETNGSENIIEYLSSDTNFNTSIYDGASQTIWSITQNHIEGYGNINSIVAHRLTEKGWVEVTLFVESHQYPELAAGFLQIVNSIQLRKGPQKEQEEGSDTNSSSYDTLRRIGLVSSVCCFLLFGLLFSFLIYKGKRELSKETSENTYLQNQERIINEFKVLPGGNKAKNRIENGCFIIMSSLLVLGVLLLGIIAAYKNPDLHMGLVVIILLIFIIIMSLFFILINFLFKKINKKLYKPFTIALLEDSIIIRMGYVVPKLKFERQEIQSVKETYFGLKVNIGKCRKVTIPKDTEGYEELKVKLMEWVNPA